jgi:hypothetical protein
LVCVDGTARANGENHDEGQPPPGRRRGAADPPRRLGHRSRRAEDLLAPAGPHSVRHFYARVAEANGVYIRQIAADLGHSFVAVSEAYLAAADTLENSAAPVLADLITAGEELALLPVFAGVPVTGDAGRLQPSPGDTETGR